MSYPASLSKIRVQFEDVINKKRDELTELNHPNFWVDYKDENLLEALKTVDENTLHEEWYKGMTCIWFGILSAYPWETCSGAHEEESIWKLILEKHTAIKGGNLIFKYNPESKIDKWLRRHTSDGDVPINVRRIMIHALEVVVKKGDFFDFIEIDWTDDPIYAEEE